MLPPIQSWPRSAPPTVGATADNVRIIDYQDLHSDRVSSPEQQNTSERKEL
jgi:hypothetical protein